MATVTCQTVDGQTVEFVDQIIGSGAMKDVYFSPDKSYVVGFYKTPQNAQARERLQMITGVYRERIFDQPGGDYWKNLFCWPTATVEHGGRLGVVVPCYQSHFFFQHGSANSDFLKIKGKEKEGKWFASANHRNRSLAPEEKGHWLGYLRVCLQLSRAVRRLHAAGLAHSDLSYKNALVDPLSGRVCLIDLDGLVVPGKYPPDVVGTPDFIAPEVVKTSHLASDNPNRCLPSIATDRHALAVLIYMYLFCRHPLRGRKIHDVTDEQNDERLLMGEKALFVEHPTDVSNRIDKSQLRPSALPWGDPDIRPFTLAGPHLELLFLKAFIDGLNNPNQRPTADEWENALIKTADLLQPCVNPACEQQWYVFDNRQKPRCPFCNTPFQGQLPILNFYSSRGGNGTFRSDQHRLMVWRGQSLSWWHVNRLVSPNERLTDGQKPRVGYFEFHENRWWLVNERLPALRDVTEKNQQRPIGMGEKIALYDGVKLLLSPEDGGRLVVVQLAGG